MEIEAKFAVTSPIDPSIFNSLDLSAYTLHATGEERHFDVILDTPVRAITSSHHALRIRHTNGHILATWKGPNTSAQGVHEREEIEAELSVDPGDDVRHLPTEIAIHVLPIAGEERLEPLVEVVVLRRTWAVRRAGATVAELALDQGTISAGVHETAVHELEVELKGNGTRKDLNAVTKRLQATLPLQPERQSKLERGLALVSDGEGHILGGHTPLAALARQKTRRQMHKIRQNAPIAREGTDPEGVHDMRVATRRLRTVFEILADAPGFDAKVLGKLRRRLRGLARDLGSVRDLDVLLEHERAYAQEQPDLADDLDLYEQALEARRGDARARLTHFLDGPKLARALSHLEDFTRHCEDAPSDEPLTLVRHFAGSALWEAYEAVLRYETLLPDATAQQLHQIRITCKKLRYTLELFEDQLGEGVKPLLKLLVKTQDILGAYHDAVVMRDQVMEVSDAHPDHQGLAIYAAALASERDQLRAAFPDIWRQLSGKQFRRQLATIIINL
ncbi:MAG: Adenylate cyclase [Ktedonobacterales bacterium]|nr:MAG: Adenylate cyclase [Ktedonobacterales bacterium]